MRFKQWLWAGILFVTVKCTFCSEIVFDHIVMYDRAASVAEINAAAELANHLGAILGKKIERIPADNSINKPVVYIGNTDFARKNGLHVSSMGAEEFRIKAVGNDLIIAGGHPRGTLYGILEFLERFAGIDWLDEWTRNIPKKERIVWNSDLDISGKPAFPRRGIYVNRCTSIDSRIQFMARRRDNLFWDERIPEFIATRWGITPAIGSPSPVHSLYYYTKDWPEDMKDCFSLNLDGTRSIARSASGPGQICFSNQRARAKIAGQLKHFIETDRKNNPGNYPKIYNLTLNDTHDYCHCPECMKRAEQYGNYSGVVLEYLNAVADEIAPVYPDVVLQTLAYLFTEKPPRGIVPCKNVSIQVALSPWSSTPLKTMFPVRHAANRAGWENLKDWRKIAKNLEVWNYWITFDSSPSCNAAMVNVPTIVENLREFYRLGVISVFSECERPDTVSFHPLRIFVGGKLQWNPEQDLELLLTRFFNGYYRNAAPAMRELYDYMVLRQKESDNLNVPDASARVYLDADFFRKTEDCLNRAESAVGNNKAIRFNILRERVPLDIARLACRQLEDEPGLLPRAEIIKRLKQNWPESIKRYYQGAVWQKKPLASMHKFLQQMSMKNAEPGLKYPLDDERITNREVFDIGWQDFNCIEELASFGLHIADDPEAIDGKAMCMTVPKRGNTEQGFHQTTFRCGVWRDGMLAASKYYPKPEDEKYHLLHVGQVELSPSTLLWMHNSWNFKQDLAPIYRPGENNRYDIYVSVKRQGPAYISGSKKNNAIYIDRIVLAAPLNTPKESTK